MKMLPAVLLLLTAAGARPARAQLSSDGPILSMMYSEQKVFHALMQTQLVQQLATLKANYDASMTYYNQFKQLNSGRGLFQNVGQQIAVAQRKEDLQIQQTLTQAFTRGTGPNNTAVDGLFNTLNQAISSNIRYAGDEMANVISDRQQGVNVAQNASGLAPKDAANLSAKAQGLQLQLMANIHEDNLRMLQMQSAMLAHQTRQEEDQSTIIQAITQSLQNRGVTVASGGNQ